VTSFIVIAAMMAALAIGLVAWPLWRAGKADDAKPSRGAAIIIAALVPVAAGLLYSKLTNYPWSSPEQMTPAHQTEMGSLEQMAAGLEERLQADQGDAEGWKLLGRTRMVMGAYDKAVQAYERAYTLTGGKDGDAMLGYAEARVLVNEADFEGEAGKLMEQAVGMAPDNPKALWYGGLVAYRKKDLEVARRWWSRLAAATPPPPEEIKRMLDERLAEIDATLGKVPAKAADATEPAAAATARPSASASAPDGAIRLRVSLAPALRAKVSADTPVFILARSGTSGPPIAVVRHTAGELPLDVTLSDENVMVKGASLAASGPVNVIARVSFTGRPMSSSGDLFGELKYDFKSREPVALNIDKVVP
jgi:cytochrome c-type biogenesis protein CcmH